jgi:hypothetical protein
MENACHAQVHVPRNARVPTTPLFTQEISMDSGTVRSLKVRSRSWKPPSTVSRKSTPIIRLGSGTSPWSRVSSKSSQPSEKSQATSTSKPHTLISPICHTSGENLHNNSHTWKKWRREETFSNYTRTRNSVLGRFCLLLPNLLLKDFSAFQSTTYYYYCAVTICRKLVSYLWYDAEYDEFPLKTWTIERGIDWKTKQPPQTH